MQENNLLLAFEVRPSCGKPVGEQPLVDQFVVEWQMGQVDSGKEGSSQLQGKPASEEFIADWSIISPPVEGWCQPCKTAFEIVSLEPPEPDWAYLGPAEEEEEGVV
jgi:hypothetical protein